MMAENTCDFVLRQSEDEKTGPVPHLRCIAVTPPEVRSDDSDEWEFELEVESNASTRNISIDIRTSLVDNTDENAAYYCRRVTEDDEPLCPFHSNLKENDGDERAQHFLDRIRESDPGVDSDPRAGTVLRSACDSVDSYRRRRKQFIGAQFGQFDLTYEGITAEDAYPIDLRCSMVKRLDWSEATVGQELRLQGTTIQEAALFEGTESAEEMLMHDVFVGGTANLTRTMVGKSIALVGAEVRGEVWLDDAEVGEEVSFGGTEVGEGVWLNGAEVGGRVWLDDAEVGEGVSLNHAEVGGRVSFTGAEITKNLDFHPDHCSALTCQNLTCHGTVNISSAVLYKYSRKTFAVSFEGATINRARLGPGTNDGDDSAPAHSVVYDFGSAEISDVEVTEPGEAPYSNLRLLDTTFDQFEFDKHRQEFRLANWDLFNTRKYGFHDIAALGELGLVENAGDDLEDDDDGGITVEDAPEIVREMAVAALDDEPVDYGDIVSNHEREDEAQSETRDGVLKSIKSWVSRTENWERRGETEDETDATEGGDTGGEDGVQPVERVWDDVGGCSRRTVPTSRLSR